MNILNHQQIRQRQSHKKTLIKASILFIFLYYGGFAQAEQQSTRTVTIKGHKTVLIGTDILVGKQAPNFTALDRQFKKVSLSKFKGKAILISVVPSLNTKICSLQTQHFNESLKTLSKDAVIITISMDLPFAQSQFCSKAKIKNMQILSDSSLREFGKAYGVFIRDRGLLSRSIFVINKQGHLIYKEIVPEVTQHPNYKEALKALKSILH